jgi:hypothetical protein
MTNHLVRVYAAAGALAAFFFAWAGIAARPWVEQPSDPRMAALDLREQRLQRDATLVQQVVDRRWEAYRAALAQSRERTTSPSVRVVTLPPVATTRSS